MSLLAWLSPKSRDESDPDEKPSILRPYGRSQRAEQRERLYPIVRDALLHSGVLSSRYKFKVLSADTRGQRFLVIIDLAPEMMQDVTMLTQVELLIAHHALTKHNFHIAGTYWRANSDLVPAQNASAAPRHAGIGATQYGELT